MMKFNPQVTIKGEPMALISIVDDGHGVIWLQVEPVARRLERIRNALGRKMDKSSDENHQEAA